MRVPFCLALLLTLCTLPLHAEDGPPVDERELLNTLNGIKQKQAENAKAQAARVIQELSKAAGGNTAAMDFFMEAIRATSFGTQQAAFLSWKRETPGLKQPEVQTAVRLQLVYLALSLQHSQGVPLSKLIPELIAYTNEIAKAGGGVLKAKVTDKDREILKSGIEETVFTKWYGIKKWFAGLPDWESVPGNVDGIWDKTILPQWRKDKDPRLIAYWDDKIQTGAAAASAANLPFYADQFNQQTKPDLLWSRAQDLLLIGQRNRALSEMMAVIKSYPDHVSNGAWIKQLSELIQKAAPAN